MRLPSTSRFFATLTLLSLGASLFSANISTRSPFLPTVANPESVQEQQGPVAVEWCGLMEMNGERYFGLTETNSNRSAWLRLDEVVQGFAVRSYTEAGPTITIEYQGRNLTLRMKESKVGALAPGSFPTVPQVGAINNAPPGIVGGDNDEQKRLAAVAAEVRRRREMRAAATANNMPPTQQPQGQPTQPALP